MKIGYLGPPGTFTEEALLRTYISPQDEAVPYASIPDVIEAVDRGEVERGIVAIENSIEGSVNVTLDVLAFDSEAKVIGEVIYPIRHNLLGRSGLALVDIDTIISQPHATAQCRKYLAVHLPEAKIIAANSTAEAAQIVSTHPGNVAAIGTRIAAEIYGLEVLAENIEDFQDNQTRFAILGKEVPPRTGFDKTSIICFIYQDRPGILLQILQEFAYRYINLTKVESRPAKRTLGEYIFFIDMEGHIQDKVVDEAIKCVTCKIDRVKFLGSYPRFKVAK